MSQKIEEIDEVKDVEFTIKQLSDWISAESEKRDVTRRAVIDELFSSYHTISDLGDLINESPDVKNSNIGTTKNQSNISEIDTNNFTNTKEKHADDDDEPSNQHIDEETLKNLIDLLSHLSDKSSVDGGNDNHLFESGNEFYERYTDHHQKNTTDWESVNEDDIHSLAESIGDIDNDPISEDIKELVDEEIEEIYENFDGINEKFEEVENSIERLETEIEKESMNTDRRIQRIESDMQTIDELLELKNKALAQDISTVVCSNCESEIEMFSLTSHECPQCNCVGVDIEVGNKWNPFDSHTLRVVDGDKFK